VNQHHVEKPSTILENLLKQRIEEESKLSQKSEENEFDSITELKRLMRDECTLYDDHGGGLFK